MAPQNVPFSRRDRQSIFQTLMCKRTGNKRSELPSSGPFPFGAALSCGEDVLKKGI